MKRLLLLTLSILLLFTACSPAPLPEREELDYEKLKEGVYVDYDRSKFENVAAPKRYYAEYVTVEDSDMLFFFSEPPEIYTVMEHETFPVRRFENDIESGYYTPLGSMFFAKECWSDFSTVFSYYWANRINPSAEKLDFMTLSEVRERFADDTHRFVTDFRIYDLYAINAEDFAHVTTVRDPPFPDRGWSEPKDFYYIRARQYVDDIPLFAGVSTIINETLWYYGSDIEACYSTDGVETFHAHGLYNVVEEAPVNGTFIDLAGAEQIIRNEYELIYPYDDMILFECDLVYVAVSEDDRIVLTPAWEFYEDLFADFIPHTNEYFTVPRIRVNAYTGEFMR